MKVNVMLENGAFMPEKAHELGIDLSFERMERRAKDYDTD